MDDPGFVDFIEASQGRLYRVAAALAGNEHDAWDLVQETFIRVGVRWSRIDSREGNPLGYARTTLVHLHVDGFRKRRRELLTGEPPDQAVSEGGEVAFDWIVATLSTLSGQQRACIVMQVLEDMPAMEIAEVLGISEGTVRSHISRGLARLRQAVAKETPHG